MTFIKSIFSNLKLTLVPLFYRKVSILFHYRLWKIFKDKIIVVYSMGKVGSSTVTRTLRKELPVVELYSAHFLSDHYLEEVLPFQHKLFHWNIAYGNHVKRALSKSLQKQKLIVTLVREPINRELSNIFQNADALLTESSDNQNIKALIDRFSHYDVYSYGLNWFDSEFKKFTNIDVYQYPFNHNKGYIVIEENGYKVLCLKLEVLNESFQDAFQNFMGLSIDKLINSNQTLRKDQQSKTHRQLKSKFQAKKSLLDEIYTSKYVQHFYSKEEISRFYENWQQE